MKVYRYQKIDAFTSGRSLGNPAACIYLGEEENLTPEEMLLVAKEHRGFVSEMVYLKKTTSGIHLTYYSSECEVDFCGHSTIAAMIGLIRGDEELQKIPEIKVETNRVGSLTVYNSFADSKAVFVSAPAAKHMKTDLTAQEIAAAMDISPDGISADYPIDLIDAGLKTLIVPIKALSDVVSVFPSREKLEALCTANDVDIILIFSPKTNDSENIAHTRVFPPKFGYLEDPATGSGNSAFGYYMLKNGLWYGEECAIEQGGCDRIQNIVRLKLYREQLLFGGGATVKIDGKYYI